MADDGRSVYWPIMVAACIGALGTVAAALVGKVELGGGNAAATARTGGQARGATTARADGPGALASGWIDARGRYYTLHQAGSTLGVVAYDGGQRALDRDKVRFTGDGTIAHGAIAWTWAGDKAKRPERCAGRAIGPALSVHCAREDGGGEYDLRLVTR